MMTKKQIKKALVLCQDGRVSVCRDCPYTENCDGTQLFKDAFALITKQEKEIERLKDENKENCWKCIEAKRVTEEDYAKLQEEFANYQIASDKEMIAQVKQAKIDVLNELWGKVKDKGVDYKIGMRALSEEIDEMIKELAK